LATDEIDDFVPFHDVRFVIVFQDGCDGRRRAGVARPNVDTEWDELCPHDEEIYQRLVKAVRDNFEEFRTRTLEFRNTMTGGE